MIDRAEFAKVMGVFADKIGRALAPATFDLYLDTLESLTTEEFLAGARIVFKTHQFNTWPAPLQFIAAAKPRTPVALEAAEAFEAVTRAVGSVYDGEGRAQRISALGPVAERAYRAAGGAREFMAVLEKDLPFLRNRFLEAYTAARTAEDQHGQAAAALNHGAPDPRVHDLIQSTAARLHSPSPRDRALPTGDR